MTRNKLSALLLSFVIALGLWSAPLVTFLKNVASGVTF